MRQDVLHLFGLERRVDGDQHDARHRCAELDHDPLGDVRGPHRHPLALLEPGGKGPGHLLGVGQQLGVGPPAPFGRVVDA